MSRQQVTPGQFHSAPPPSNLQALFRRGQLKALVDVHSTQSGMGGYLTPDEIRCCALTAA